MAKYGKRLLGFVIIFMLLSLYMVYAGESENVIDELNYLAEGDIDALQQEIQDIKDTRQLEAVIVITDETNDKSSMAFADDYYDEHGYGVGSDHSGLLMLVNMDQREVWISPTGHAIDVFTDARISSIVDQITPNLSDADYNKACQIFLELVDNYAAKGVPVGQHRVETSTNTDTYTDTYTAPTYLDKVGSMMSNGIVYLIALIIGIVATVGLTLSRKGKVTINNLTYEEKGSFALTSQQDDFLREFVTKVKIQTNSGGGSSTHSGSSGTSHGGGGGKF